MNDKLIEAVGISHAFGAVEVLSDIDLTIRRGEIVAIVGPSGCGKTTLLHLLSGHIAPTAGRIERHGSVRTVYQKDGLFPWLTVAENIALGLRHVADDVQRRSQLDEALKLVGLVEFADFYPHHLSGGMRQRTELARALMSRAETLLMDEPFSALDYLTRLHLRHELVRLLHRMPRTVVLVTHDIEEAAQLADRVILLSRRPSRVWKTLNIQATRPRRVTQHEVTQAVSELLGVLNLDHAGEMPVDAEPETAT
jgi:ABC-type nitrate/sulfonate/bicarbonate transport system ATPase subunit